MLNKIILILILCFDLCNLSYAKDSMGKNCDQGNCTECFKLYPDDLKFDAKYKNGKLDGLVQIYYGDGTLWEKQVYKEGILLDENNMPKNGIYKRFYRNGQLAKEVQLKDGLPEGESKSFYENGNIKVTENFINQDEYLLKAYDERGKLINDGKIVSQKYTGIHRIYNDQDELEWEYSYEKSVPSGIMKHFSKKGKLDWEYLYNEGKATGDVKQYYESGRLKLLGKKNGEKWGSYEEYYENGALKAKMANNDKNECILKEYDENGKVSAETLYKNGEPNKVMRDYYETGGF